MSSKYLAILLLCVCSIGSANAFEVQVAEAPDNDLQLTVGAIQSARESLLINIYDLSSPEIADAIIAQISHGVTVQMIQEGQPVGGVSAAARGIQAQVVQAMKSAKSEDHLYEMTSAAGGKRRFHFDHAKYIVIDGASLLVGSENYSPTGNPQPGSLGNRGWEVLVHNDQLAQKFAAVFQADSNMSAGDLIDLTQSGGFFAESAWATRPRPRPPAPRPPAPPSGGSGIETMNANGVLMITSPDTSLNGLVALLNSARQSIDIEQMTFDSLWLNGGQSPLIAAVVSAAKRGVHIRVLLNDESVFNHGNSPEATAPSSRAINGPTADLLNRGRASGYAIEARIANVKAMGVDYIHNKGALVDGRYTLISSINWDSNAVLYNREAAVVLDSPEANAYYERLFDQDWQNSPGTGNLEATFSGPIVLPSFCPDSLTVKVQIGELNLSDPKNASFAAIQDKTIEVNVLRAKRVSGCVLVEDTDQERHWDGTGAKRVVEIRHRSANVYSIDLQGYTPGNLIYSVQTLVGSPNEFLGEHSAGVYNASAPARDQLGKAELDLAQ